MTEPSDATTSAPKPTTVIHLRTHAGIIGHNVTIDTAFLSDAQYKKALALGIMLMANNGELDLPKLAL